MHTGPWKCLDMYWKWTHDGVFLFGGEQFDLEVESLNSHLVLGFTRSAFCSIHWLSFDWNVQFVVATRRPVGDTFCDVTVYRQRLSLPNDGCNQQQVLKFTRGMWWRERDNTQTWSLTLSLSPSLCVCLCVCLSLSHSLSRLLSFTHTHTHTPHMAGSYHKVRE